MGIDPNDEQRVYAFIRTTGIIMIVYIIITYLA